MSCKMASVETLDWNVGALEGYGHVDILLWLGIYAGAVVSV